MLHCIDNGYEVFAVYRIKNGRWGIYNSNGELLRICKTKKECFKRIEEQTI